MITQIANSGLDASSRTIDQLHEQYLVEIELAARLKRASRQERRELYSVVYDELYSRVPHHPGNTRQCDPETHATHIADQLALFRSLLRPEDTFLEVGAGDCGLAIEVAKYVRSVIAVEVRRFGLLPLPDNCQLLIGDGIGLDLPEESVNLAFSYQVTEHLHEQDAEEQLQRIHRALVPGGRYVCVTPHRYMGPSDISRYFSLDPVGMHLKEYTNGELGALFRRVGFTRIRSRVSLKWSSVSVPLAPIAALERALSLLPQQWRRAIATRLPLRPILSICVIGTK